MRSILFVDDHPIYREGLRRTLESEIRDLRVTTAGNAESATALLGCGTDFDLCLSDYRLPDMDGLALLRLVRRRYPSTAAGLLCADLSLSLLDQARAMGLVLCLSKDRTVDELVSAIHAVFQGTQVFDRGAARVGSDEISLRRREVLAYASEGLLDKQIGERIGISESTVRSHWVQIFAQLKVSNRTEAVTKALRQRLI